MVARQLLLSMEFSRREYLEWVAISFSRGSLWLRDQTQVSHIAGRFFIIWATSALLSFNLQEFPIFWGP